MHERGNEKLRNLNVIVPKSNILLLYKKILNVDGLEPLNVSRTVGGQVYFFHRILPLSCRISSVSHVRLGKVRKFHF